MNFCIKLDLGVGFYRCGLAVNVEGDTVTVRDMEASSKDRATFPLHQNSAWAELVNFAEEGKVIIVPGNEYDSKLSLVKILSVTTPGKVATTVFEVGRVFPRAEEYNTKEDFRKHHFGNWCDPAAVFLGKIVKLDQARAYQVFFGGRTYVVEYSRKDDWQDGRRRVTLRNICRWDYFPDGRTERHIDDAEAYRVYRLTTRSGDLPDRLIKAILSAWKEDREVQQVLQTAFPLWDLWE